MFCIAGADGFFGSYIQKSLLSRGECILALNHRISVFGDSETVINLPFEVSDNDSIGSVAKALSRYKNIRLIYLTAAHNPDFVKANPEKARYINETAYRDFLTAVSDCDISNLYYASSDTVYGESRDGKIFTEEDTPNPVNAYGEQKAKAEEITRSFGYTAVRFPYMFAPSFNGKKHFFDKITDELKQGNSISMFTDYIRSSLTYPTAAEWLVKLIKSETAENTVNICADNPTSKYDIGLYAAECADADRGLVIPTLMNDSGVFTERRAGTLIMSNKKLKSLIGDSSPIGF